MKLLRLILILLIISCIAQTVIHYPDMPNTMASHFGADGFADRWAPKKSFFTLYLSIVGLYSLIFLIAPLSQNPRLARFVSIPNKQYWLAPERQAETFKHLQKEVILFGIASMVLSLYAVQVVILANLMPQPNINEYNLGLLFTAYMIYVILWIMRILVHFKKIE